MKKKKESGTKNGLAPEVAAKEEKKKIEKLDGTNGKFVSCGTGKMGEDTKVNALLRTRDHPEIFETPSRPRPTVARPPHPSISLQSFKLNSNLCTVFPGPEDLKGHRQSSIANTGTSNASLYCFISRVITSTSQ